MGELRVLVKAPSNIAWIKYMGKKESSTNLPANPSFSMTLNHLCTWMEIQTQSSSQMSFKWESAVPLSIPQERKRSHFQIPHLNEKSRQRVFQFLKRIRSELSSLFHRFDLAMDDQRINQSEFIFKTVNTFPESSGIASSASSFAALTLAFATVCATQPEVLVKFWGQEIEFRRGLSKISRLGSGSSCRSLMGPWVLWEEEDVTLCHSDEMPELVHFVILLNSQPKAISSSDAHQRIQSSPLWLGRTQRVNEQLKKLLGAFQSGDLPFLSKILWKEAWEMHSLFHTCETPFSYWEPETLAALKWLGQWIDSPAPPLVTLDAGPNIHVSVKSSEQEFWRKRLQEQFSGTLILEDQPGEGAKIYELVRI